jgi:hypothetical protein
VVLAGSKDEFPRECEREVFARMTRPFNIPSITECIDTIGDNAKA